MKPEILVWNDIPKDKKDFFLKRSESDISNVMESVSEIINSVRLNGDKALLKYTLQFDGIDFSEKELRVSINLVLGVVDFTRRVCGNSNETTTKFSRGRREKKNSTTNASFY